MQCPVPFPVQRQCLPAIMKGRDVLGVAQTGSGKTLAYVLPLLRHVLAQPALEPFEGPIAIILLCTRELADQVGKTLNLFASAPNNNNNNNNKHEL